MITQVPAPSKETTPAFIEQTEEAVASIVRVTAKPDVAVAVGVYVGPPIVALDGAVDVKLMDCDKRVSVATFRYPVVSAKKLSSVKPATELVEPQVPKFFPKPPKARLFTPRFGPVILAFAVPVGAMLRFPVVSVELLDIVMDLSPEPLKIKLLYVTGLTVCAPAPL